MRAVFVDVDGVLNNEIMFVEKDKNRFGDEPYPISAFDSRCVDRLNDIFKETEAKFVLSSSWRLDKKENLQNIFSKIGLPTEFDKTPSTAFWNEELCRGDEIKEYLNNHPEIDNYCIIDDDNDMLAEQKSHFVRCKPYYGLTDEDCDKIKSILLKS